VTECAYEQWHRLLFARFLAENNLLIHPEFHAPVTLETAMNSPARSESPTAGQSRPASPPRSFLASSGSTTRVFACVSRPKAGSPSKPSSPTFRQRSSQLTTPSDGCTSSGRRTRRTRSTLGAQDRRSGPWPGDQLFTENYMVRFLLENSLGAWWAVRHPDSRLVKSFQYLRFNDEASPRPGPSLAGPIVSSR